MVGSKLTLLRALLLLCVSSMSLIWSLKSNWPSYQQSVMIGKCRCKWRCKNFKCKWKVKGNRARWWWWHSFLERGLTNQPLSKSLHLQFLRLNPQSKRGKELLVELHRLKENNPSKWGLAMVLLQLVNRRMMTSKMLQLPSLMR